MAEDVEIPKAFTHSLKVEDTAKGLRFSVHVYANDRKTAVTEAFELYDGACVEAESRKLTIAPVELSKK